MTSLHRQSLKLLATWFGCGRAPKIPGTVGTLGAIPMVWIFQHFGDVGYMAATLLFTVFAWAVAHAYEFEVVHEHDTPELVIDEVAGFLVTMVWLPFTWTWVLLGFVTFRAFDMLKPWPISRIDRDVKGGLGAVADDLAAGVISSVILQILWQQGLWK